MEHSLAVIAVVATLVAAGCSDSSTSSGRSRESPKRVSDTREGAETRSAPAKPAEARGTEASPEELAEQGRQIYLSTCIACHNADPAKDGALGPAVAGSSRELVEARVLRGEYPDGTVPKREGAVMVAMPFLEKQIPALAAYLAPAPR